LEQTALLSPDLAQRLISSRTKRQWKRIGACRRSGVAVPLFSIFSESSCGIGEIPDIKPLVNWCRETSLSIIQLLPLNDVGFNFRPYDAQSMFALDPMYLAPDRLKGVTAKEWASDIQQLKTTFPTGESRVDYRIKGAKLELFWKIFNASCTTPPAELTAFIAANAYWLEDYAAFRTIKEKQQEKDWQDWPPELKTHRPETLASLAASDPRTHLFQQWLQWQLYEQFLDAKAYAARHGVLLMGDLPFLVSRDSADVWAHQDYFKLDLASGAPPDMLYSQGQRWGMPPYNWPNIAAHNYDYVIEKLKYAENFYDLYRIDHVVGMFRVWTIPVSEPEADGGLHGTFDPADEKKWESHGRRLLDVLVHNTNMLACAEDLGTIPECTFRVLNEYGIPGIDVQRWVRDWGASYDFKGADAYRPMALATLATHDMSSLLGWWQFEAGTVDKGLFERACRQNGIDFTAVAERLFDLAQTQHDRLRWREPNLSVDAFCSIIGKSAQEAWNVVDLFKGSISERDQYLKFLGCPPGTALTNPHIFVKMALERINAASCIFSSLLLQDWLAIDTLFDFDPWEERINFPGTVDPRNWTLAIPLALEDIAEMPVNSVIRHIVAQHQRVPPNKPKEAS